MARKSRDREPRPVDTQPAFGLPVAGTPQLHDSTDEWAGSESVAQVPAPVAPVKQPGRARPGLIVLVGFLLELAMVLGVGNTVVVRKLGNINSDIDVVRGLLRLPGVYSWRFTPGSGDRNNLWLGSVVGLLVFLAVAAVLTLALVRGPVTFWRAFVGVWLSVIVATLVDGMVFRTIFTRAELNPVGDSPAARALFGGNGFEIAAGVVAGLPLALILAIVAVASRRRADVVLPEAGPELPPYIEPSAPPPWHGDGEGPAQYSATPRRDESLASSDQTMSFRKDAADADRYGGPAAAGDEQTTRFPAAAAGAAGAVGAAGAAAAYGAGDRDRDGGGEGWSEVRRSEPHLPVVEPADERESTPVSEADRPGEQDDATQALPVSPAESAPAESAPSEPAPTESTPAEPEATQAVPVQPAESTPAEPTPAESTPAEPEATQAVPVQPAEPTPAEPTPTQALPVQRDFPRPPDDEDLGHHPDEE